MSRSGFQQLFHAEYNSSLPGGLIASPVGSHPSSAPTGNEPLYIPDKEPWQVIEVHVDPRWGAGHPRPLQLFSLVWLWNTRFTNVIKMTVTAAHRATGQSYSYRHAPLLTLSSTAICPIYSFGHPSPSPRVTCRVNPPQDLPTIWMISSIKIFFQVLLRYNWQREFLKVLCNLTSHANFFYRKKMTNILKD